MSGLHDKKERSSGQSMREGRNGKEGEEPRIFSVLRRNSKSVLNHGKSRQISTNHGKSVQSQQITANHGKSVQITANHGKSVQITANHGKCKQEILSCTVFGFGMFCGNSSG